MPDPTPEFITKHIGQCAQFLPNGDNPTQNVAIRTLVQAVRDLSGNLCSLREYANELEDRVAKIEARS